MENYIDAIPHIVFSLTGSNIKLPLILIFESRIFRDYGISQIINEVFVF
jgi:hypothetical protein